MYNLAVLYNEGSGVKKDFRKAAEWFEKAAMAGNASAMNSLGVCYLKGQGLPKNLEMAATWFWRGAKAGEPLAMFNMGICYLKGQGVKPSEREALAWLDKSDKAGYKPARAAIDQIRQRRTAAMLNLLGAMARSGAFDSDRGGRPMFQIRIQIGPR